MPRQQTWIGHDVLVRLLNLAAGRPELNELAMIFLASYAFLLRVPSECLPMAAHEAPCNSEVPVFCIRGVTPFCVCLFAKTAYSQQR